MVFQRYILQNSPSAEKKDFTNDFRKQSELTSSFSNYVSIASLKEQVRIV